jgi:hypothetical protein
MHMVPVHSSALRAVGYDPTSCRMKITFLQGDTYDFCGVPANVYECLMSAHSKGVYYNDHIRDRYQCF